MCGLAGIASLQPSLIETKFLVQMGDAIFHRGPDSSGTWTNGSNTLGIVHRRLAIQDLSKHGHQPMMSPSNRYVIAFNGEIYNFVAIQKTLIEKGFSFKGHSDTEVIVAAFEYWGIDTAISQMAGMFAIAVVDQQENHLTLIRDRMGEKPLYYGWFDNAFFFGSELKAIKAHPAFMPDIDRNALTLLLRHNFISGPHTVYEGIYKLPPGSRLTLDLMKPDKVVVPKVYWRVSDSLQNSFQGSYAEAVILTDRQLNGIVQDQMISDAPLGAFLSGGVDSSTIVAMMQAQSNRPINTFSIGFGEKEFNEAIYAKEVAKHLGTNHIELYVNAEDALNIVPKLASIYDEPFADSSQIPTLMLSEMTRKHVTVVLSGDGGDELFCGYNRYRSVVERWLNLSSPKQKLRSTIQTNLPISALALAGKLAKPKSDSASMHRWFQKDNLKRASNSLQEYYKQSVSYWPQPESTVLQSTEPDYSMTSSPPGFLIDNPYKLLMWQDLNWYLPDDILVKVDRAAMAHSLETRVPMLDHRFVENVLSFPVNWNLGRSGGKQILKDVLSKYVPIPLIERPKQGFGIPLDDWLRGPLKEWAGDLVNPVAISRQGYFDGKKLQQIWASHFKGENNGFELWGILMFQAWLAENGIF